jgi:uncharacterized protein (TIGR02246 family)
MKKAMEENQADEIQIRTIVEAQQEAWNRGDGEAYAAHFLEDGSFTNVLGDVNYGRAIFERRHAEIFGTIFLHSQITIRVRRVAFPLPDTAIVDCDTDMTSYHRLPPGVHAAADGVLRTRLLEVLVKIEGQWWIAAYHNVDLKIRD